MGGDKFGKVVAISLDDRTVDVKKRQDTASAHPEAVFAHTFIGNQVLADAIFRIGEYVADNGIEGPGRYRAARDLLLKVAPRLASGDLRNSGESALDSAMRVALSLDQSVFPVQGPPGAGKTHIGARMIRELAGKKLKVGITANSHKVIRLMLDKTLEAAAETKTAVECIQKVSDDETSLPHLQFVTENPEFIDGLSATCRVGGATSWFWARSDATEIVDVLFVDEAAQMSLANVLAVSQAAKSVVLLGDPRQLEQPIQGSHPDGVAVSALDHILGEHATIEADRGLFLEETWRMHPDVCAFTSEAFYDGRLRSRPGLERQEIKSKSRANGTGLRYLAVPHEGNQNFSPEEVEQVRILVADILSCGTTWVNDKGIEAAVTLSDILIIAPYNAQVFELQDAIPGARVGTVDQISGAGGADRDLLDDNVEPRRCPAWHGVLVQFETAQCRDVAGKVPVHPCGVAARVRGRVPHATADAARQRLLSILGARQTAVRSANDRVIPQHRIRERRWSNLSARFR